MNKDQSGADPRLFSTNNKPTSPTASLSPVPENSYLLYLTQSMDGGITSGYLEKWTNYVTGWKPRFFIVQEGMLSYYASKASVRDGTRGSMVLSEARVIQIDGTSFKITAGSTAFYLRASNSKELKAWIKVLDPLSKPADRRGSWASPSQTSKLHRTVGVSSDETGRSYEHQTLPSRLVFPQLPSPESAEGPADLSMSEQLKHGASAAEAAEIRSLCSKLEHFEQSFNRSGFIPSFCLSIYAGHCCYAIKHRRYPHMY